MGTILLLIFEISMVTGVFILGYKLWKKADLQDKATQAQTVEAEYVAVNRLEKTHKNLEQKSKKVTGYKKQTF